MYLPIGFSSEYPLLHSSPHRQSRKISTPSGESLQLKISHSENLVLLTNKTAMEQFYLFIDCFEYNRKICFSDNTSVDVMTCYVSGFCHGAGEALLLLKLRRTAWPVKMGRITRPKTLLTDYQPTMHKTPEQQSPLCNNKWKYTQINGYMLELILKPSSWQYIHI